MASQVAFNFDAPQEAKQPAPKPRASHEFIPTFAADAFSWYVVALKQVKHMWVYRACWHTASAVCLETTTPQLIQHRFSNHASSRITGAEEKHVKDFFGHHSPQQEVEQPAFFRLFSVVSTCSVLGRQL